jgi:hypothetical protein
MDPVRRLPDKGPFVKGCLYYQLQTECRGGRRFPLITTWLYEGLGPIEICGRCHENRLVFSRLDPAETELGRAAKLSFASAWDALYALQPWDQFLTMAVCFDESSRFEVHTDDSQIRNGVLKFAGAGPELQYFDTEHERIDKLAIHERISLDAVCTHVSNTDDVKELEYRAPGDASDFLARLDLFPNLEVLSISRARVSPEALGDLSRLSNLKRVQLNGSRVSDACLEELANCSNLRSLVLIDEPGISRHGVRHLARLPNLTTLLMFEMRFGDDMVQEVASLPQLTEFGFDSPRVTEAGFLALERLCGLRSLSLLGPQVTDAVLKGFEVLRSLKSLILTQTVITYRGLRAFRESVPGCHVLVQ